MGKTPKKAAPGGDERNMYELRLKSTNATSKVSETILPEQQRENDGLNRSQLTRAQKKIPTARGKYFRSKLRRPTKFCLNHPSKHLTKAPGTSNSEKNPSESIKSTAPADSAMQSKAEEAEVNANAPLQKENSKESLKKEVSKDGSKESSKEELEEKKVVEAENEEETPVTTDKQTVPEHTVDEATSADDEQVDSKHPETPEKSVEKAAAQPDEPVDSPGKENDAHESNNNNEPREELSDSEMKLTLDAEDDSTTAQNHEEASSGTEAKNEDGKKEVVDNETDSEVKSDEENKSEESEVTSNDTKSITNDKDDRQSEPRTDTESGSVDVVEKVGSTGAGNNDSFVSYDASIMLKDVQIKLNDCLKDNSKLFEVSNSEKGTSTHPSKELSFGRTLRNISGRHSISRMRHITTRENRLSPNSSLFVNTSGTSMTQDETPADRKVSSYGSVALSEPYSTNGSPLERKRKLGSVDWSSAKKPKTEHENSLLNTSIGIIKGLRRPMQVSTPNKAGYKFQAEKLNISSISSSDDEKTLEENEGTKKWCVIM